LPQVFVEHRGRDGPMSVGGWGESHATTDEPLALGGDVVGQQRM
jgi:hypothetical protein